MKMEIFTGGSPEKLKKKISKWVKKNIGSMTIHHVTHVVDHKGLHTVTLWY